ncbi:MAG: HAMP domain-containing protein [Myxococcales bacterium]|nr:HAMP domain-containing protein [Myxococcales bacterium]
MAPSAWPLRRLLTVAFLAVGLLALLPLSLLNLVDTHALLRARAIGRLQSRATATAASLDEAVGDLVRWTRQLQADPDVAELLDGEDDADDERTRAVLRRLQRVEELSGLQVIDAAGRVRMTAGVAPDRTAPLEFARPGDADVRIFVQGAGTPSATFYVAGPHVGGGGQRGLVLLGQSLTELRARVAADEDAAGAESFGALTEADGRVIIHGRHTQAEGAKDMLTGDGIAVSAPLRQAPWTYHLVVPTSWVEAPIRAQLLRVVIASVALLLLVGLVARALARRLAAPITALERTMARWGAGATGLRAPTLAGAEARRLAAAFDEMATQIEHHHAILEQQVAERTRDLEAANHELELFTYSASHDLRAPLRIVDGYANALLEDYGAALDDEGRQMLGRLVASAERMRALIEDLLAFGRLSRQAIERTTVDLSALAADIGAELRDAHPGHPVTLIVAADLVVEADASMCRVVLTNLLDNAWKYTGRQANGRVELGRDDRGLFVRDDGAGFDPAHARQLFAPFGRLHAAHEFAGTGIGLATVDRILQRHGGWIEADSAPGEGAVFHFDFAPRA